MRKLLSMTLLALVAAAPGLAKNDPPTSRGPSGAVAVRPVTEEAAGIVFHRSGMIEVDGRIFGGMEEWTSSKEFKQQGRRCFAEKQPLQQRLFSRAASDCSMTSTTIRSEFDPVNGDVYQIPVVFHVIRKSDGTGNISDALITSQIDILNEDFRAFSGSFGGNGTDSKIEFYLTNVDENGNATTGITRTTSNAYFTDPGPGAANDMKQALNWDPTRFFNIYSNDANGALGYATFPQQDAGTYQDGIVLLYSSIGRNAPGGGIYDQGRTATHEVGHYLGLFHTFQDGCGTGYTQGDLIADTEAQSSPNYSCPAGASSCGSRDAIENYMNYTQDTCMETFTSEQINRMRCAIDAYRSSLVGGSTPPPPPPPADTVLENGVAVSGLSGSTGSEQHWTMDVPAGATNLSFQMAGGSGDADLYARFGSAPTTSSYDCRPYLNGNSETCSFASPSAGTYYVMVRAYSTFSSVSLGGSYDSSAPNVGPTAAFSSSTSDLTASFSNTSSDSDGTISSSSWTFGDGGTSSATNPSHTYAAAGTFTVTLTVTDNDGASDSVTHSVTVTDPPAGGGMQNGVPLTDLADSQGGQEYSTVDISAGATNLVFTMSGGTGDADLYVRFGSQPTTSSYDCRPYRSGNNETCAFASPSAGTYHVMIRAYSAYSGVSLVATWDEPGGGGGGACADSGSATNVSGAKNSETRYTWDVPSCASTFTVQTTGGTGDADLYVRFGSQPTTSSYDCRPWLSGNNETCSFNSPSAGTWHIMLRGYSAYSGVDLSVSHE